MVFQLNWNLTPIDFYSSVCPPLPRPALMPERKLLP